MTFCNRSTWTTAVALTALAGFSAAPADAAVTVMQYGYDFTSGTVLSNGNVINDDSGSGNHGVAATIAGDGNGGTYTPDIPAANLLQNATGIGSVDITNGRHLTTTANIFDRTDVIDNGGLTLQTWIKPNIDSGTTNWSADINELILSEGGFVSLGVGNAIGEVGVAADGVVNVGV